ncbi:hypothetical protein J4P02_19280 [Pseudomonas sp. NFXW11]|uniref:phage tail terminator protein n=1 Tax=Pseudomonas sp. NFXW11 TaxID=2819531 RepID=UPI003CEC524F
MKFSAVLTQLNNQCPSLAGRILAGINPDTLAGNTSQAVPAAQVSPINDLASASAAQNAQGQAIRERCEVLLVLDATDATKALELMHDLRAEIWRALVGFKPGPDYNPIEYEGGELVSLNATRLLYRLRFFAEFQLGRNLPSQPAETWHERELDGLPSLTGVTVRVDAIDPADPNLKKPGPDGRLELTFSGELKQ